MGLVLFKPMLKKLGVVLAFAVLLSACSPRLDWRTVQSPQERYSALFPGKPEKIERRLPYQNQEIPQTLEAVKIEDDIYSVSTIQLSKDQVVLAPKLLEQLQGNLLSRANVNLESAVTADAFYQAGFDVVIWEKFDAHKEYISQNAPHLKIIDKPITTDIMAFIEVAEHMTDKELNALFKKIKPNYILFSSTSQRIPEWDESWGHISIKDQHEWDAIFAEKGYEIYKQLTIPTPWAKIYKLK